VGWGKRFGGAPGDGFHSRARVACTALLLVGTGRWVFGFLLSFLWASILSLAVVCCSQACLGLRMALAQVDLDH